MQIHRSLVMAFLPFPRSASTVRSRRLWIRHSSSCHSIRLRHLARRTETVFHSWAGRFLSFAGVTPPSINQNHLEAFLTHLAVGLKVSAVTQRQAFNALLFLFRNVLSVRVLDLEPVVRARIGKSLPVMLSGAEVRRIISHLRESIT